MDVPHTTENNRMKRWLSETGNFMSWAQESGRSGPLAVYGPEGVEQVVRGFNMAYQLDSSYRVAHHGEAVMPSQAAGMQFDFEPKNRGSGRLSE